MQIKTHTYISLSCYKDLYFKLKETNNICFFYFETKSAYRNFSCLFTNGKDMNVNITVGHSIHICCFTSRNTLICTDVLIPFLVTWQIFIWFRSCQFIFYSYIFDKLLVVIFYFYIYYIFIYFIKLQIICFWCFFYYDYYVKKMQLKINVFIDNF